MGKSFHGLDCGIKRFPREVVFSINFLAQAQGFFLIIDHIIGLILVNMADDKPCGVGADINNCGTLHFSPLCVIREKCGNIVLCISYHKYFMQAGKNPVK